MKTFLEVIDACPQNVRDYINQGRLVDAYVKILNEMEAFKSLAFSSGFDRLGPQIENARAMFLPVLDALHEEKNVA